MTGLLEPSLGAPAKDESRLRLERTIKVQRAGCHSLGGAPEVAFSRQHVFSKHMLICSSIQPRFAIPQDCEFRVSVGEQIHKC